MTYASANSSFESGTVWVGAPAKHLRQNKIPEEQETPPKDLLRRYWLSQVALTVCQPVLTYCSVVSIFVILWALRKVLADARISIYWYFLIFAPVLVFGEFVQAFIMFCLKWMLAGKYTTSIHPFYSYHYTSWILLTNILLQCSLINQFGGSIWLVWWARLLGAKIGENVCYFSFRRVEMDLLRIGDKSIIGQESVISGHTLENQVIEHIRTDIGSEAWVGARTTLLPGSSMSTNSQVDHLSLVLKVRCAQSYVISLLLSPKIYIVFPSYPLREKGLKGQTAGRVFQQHRMPD
jgi:acetyltransferase-like isoleucine patch superfamily enzyme